MKYTLQDYHNNNRHVYFDDFYTSPKLIKDLESKSVYACETVQVDRGKFSENFKKAKPERGESFFISAVTFSLSIGKSNMFLLHVLSIPTNVLKFEKEIKPYSNHHLTLNAINLWVVSTSVTSFRVTIQLATRV